MCFMFSSRSRLIINTDVGNSIWNSIGIGIDISFRNYGSFSRRVHIQIVVSINVSSDISITIRIRNHPGIRMCSA